MDHNDLQLLKLMGVLFLVALFFSIAAVPVEGDPEADKYKDL